jgi:hypothetical protein
MILLLSWSHFIWLCMKLFIPWAAAASYLFCRARMFCDDSIIVCFSLSLSFIILNLLLIAANNG